MAKVDATEVTQFILDHYPRARNSFDKESLLNWVKWHMGNDTCLLAGDKDGLAGVGLVRTLFDAKDHADDTHFDPEGDTYFVDMCVLRDPRRKLLQLMVLQTLKRFGQRPKTAFQWHGTGEVIVVDTKEHLEKLLKFPPEHHVTIST